MDGQAFDAFYAASVGRLVGQLYVMTGDRAEAQDVVQEAFVRAWEHRAQLDEDVYDATLREGGVEITVKQLRADGGTAVPTGVVHQVTLSPQTPVEVKRLAGGKPEDVRLAELIDRLRGGPRWVFALDYDGEGRIQSLREAFWLTAG